MSKSASAMAVFLVLTDVVLPARAADAPVRRGFAQVAEPVLYYETAGKGPPVVFIHGGQMDCRMWDDQFQVFAKRFQVIRYDVRTYGQSEMPTRPYSDVEDVASLLRFLHVKKAHLVGLSLGGRIIIDFALEHPDMVESLVAVGPGLSGFTWTQDDERDKAMMQAMQVGKFDELTDLWLTSGYMKPAMENPAIAPRLSQLCRENYKNWLGNPLLARPIDPPAIKRLKQIKAPTLVVVGSRDIPDIQRIVKKLKDDISHARQVTIEGAGHIVNIEKPQEFNRVVLDFLKEQGERESP